MSFASSSVSGFVGLTRIATGEALGTISCSSASLLEPSRAAYTLTPVALPPGRLRLATSPALIGSSPVVKQVPKRHQIGGLVAPMLPQTAPPHTLWYNCPSYQWFSLMTPLVANQLHGPRGHH